MLNRTNFYKVCLTDIHIHFYQLLLNLKYNFSNTRLLCSQFFKKLPDAQPTQMEEETYAIVHEVLQHSKRILLELQLYQGAGNAIREVG